MPGDTKIWRVIGVLRVTPSNDHLNVPALPFVKVNTAAPAALRVTSAGSKVAAPKAGPVVWNLVPPIGFVFDTSLALARCIYDGFLDRYPNVKLIAGHGGGALPYLIGRLDFCHERIPTCGARTKERPSNYMRRIYVDTVLFRQDAMQMCVDVCGPENVLYGSDYPHNIGDMTGCLGRVDALGGELRHLVRGRNAAKILNLS